MYLCYTIPTYSCTQVWIVRYPGQVVQRGEGSSSVFMLHNTYIFMYSSLGCTLPWTSGPTGGGCHPVYSCYTIPTYSCTQGWVVRYPGQVVQWAGVCIQCIFAPVTQYLHIHILEVGVYATLDKWSNGGRVSVSVFMLHNTYIIMHSRSVCTLPWTSGPTGRR